MKRIFDFLVNNMPLALRGSKVIHSILRAVAFVLGVSKAQMEQYFEEQNYYLRITPQVFLLERLLNKKVHEVDKKIRIGDPLDTPGIFFSPENADSMCYFDNDEFFAYLDPFGMDLDFIVFVPSYYKDKTDALNTIKFYLDIYKLVSTNYEIIFE